MKRLVMILVLSTSAVSAAAGQSVVQPVLRTAPLFNYEDAPATPDADDPAIWINRRDHKQSLIIGTAKDAGLLVYDLSGQLVQAMFPPNAPQVTAADPATTAGLNPGPGMPCADSVSGETFGRYNNVDIAYDVRLGKSPKARGLTWPSFRIGGAIACASSRSIWTIPMVRSSTSRLQTCRASFRAAMSSLPICSRPVPQKGGSTTRSTIRIRSMA